MSYPVSIETRVAQSWGIALGHVTSQQCYAAARGNINTLNQFEITAWIKNNSSTSEVGVITLGGVLGNRATQVDPAIQLDDFHEYI